MKHFSLLLSVLMTCAAAHGESLVIGGWSTNRAGPSSLVEGPFTEEWRGAVSGAFPGSTFVGIDTLTPAALNNLDALIVGAPTFSGVISLSSSEQTALLDFVRAGRRTQIYFDNDSYAGVPTSDDAAETFLDPFGIDAVGRVPSQAPATAIAPGHPVINGPFGTVTSLFTNFGGWFETLGPATPLAQYDPNGQIALAVIAPGALGPGSGPVVILGDADPVVDSGDGGLFGLADNRIYFLNALAYTPEPSAALLLLGAGAFCAGRRPRRQLLPANLSGERAPHRTCGRVAPPEFREGAQSKVGVPYLWLTSTGKKTCAPIIPNPIPGWPSFASRIWRLEKPACQ